MRTGAALADSEMGLPASFRADAVEAELSLEAFLTLSSRRPSIVGGAYGRHRSSVARARRSVSNTGGFSAITSLSHGVRTEPPIFARFTLTSTQDSSRATGVKLAAGIAPGPGPPVSITAGRWKRRRDYSMLGFVPVANPAPQLVQPRDPIVQTVPPLPLIATS